MHGHDPRAESQEVQDDGQVWHKAEAQKAMTAMAECH
jgi:hypothetical protein